MFKILSGPTTIPLFQILNVCHITHGMANFKGDHYEIVVYGDRDRVLKRLYNKKVYHGRVNPGGAVHHGGQRHVRQPLGDFHGFQHHAHCLIDGDLSACLAA